MQQFAFSQDLAAEVKRRMDILNLNNEWLNGVMLATAQANGCGPTDRVQLKSDGSGIVVTPDPEFTPLRDDTAAEEMDEERLARLDRAQWLINTAKKKRLQTVTTDEVEQRM